MNDQEFNPEEAYQKAMIAHQSGRVDEAEAILRQILEHMPDQDGIMSTLGGLLLSNGKTEDGIKLFEKAIQLNPKNAEAHLNLGIALQGSGNAEKAFELISHAATLEPNRTDIQFNFANVLLQKKQYPQAIEKLNQVIQLNPNFIPAYQNLGAVYSYLQKPNEAIEIYKKSLSVAPNDLNTLVTLASVLENMGRVEEAQETYLQTIELHPNHYVPQAALGKFYLEIGKDKEGLAALEKAFSLNPNDLTTNILLGNVSNNLGREDDAEKFYRQALAIDPNEESAIRNLRRILATKIPYWHFEMLADTERNDAYQEAIEKIIDEECIVLDIGTGSGLLSMMAARAGAKQITACELHERLAETAKEITKQNGFEKIITVFSKKSTQLKIGEEMPSKANVIISEILDCGALGEGILPSIRHAVQNLAIPNVKLIPSKVNLYGQLIEIPSRSLVAPIREISGFDLSHFEKFRIPGEYLKINLKAEKYKKLSPVIPLLDIDFYNLPAAYSDEQPLRIPLDVPISETGMAQAFVFWFDLFLDDEIMVSSKLDGKLEHWGQALFCFPNPKKVEKGEQLSITMLQSDLVIRFEI